MNHYSRTVTGGTEKNAGHVTGIPAAVKVAPRQARRLEIPRSRAALLCRPSSRVGHDTGPDTRDRVCSV